MVEQKADASAVSSGVAEAPAKVNNININVVYKCIIESHNLALRNLVGR